MTNTARGALYYMPDSGRQDKEFSHNASIQAAAKASGHHRSASSDSRPHTDGILFVPIQLVWTIVQPH